MNVDGRFSITFWTYTKNCGDGSCVVCFFNSAEEAEDYAGDDDERYCEDIESHTLQLDENHRILNPDKRLRLDGN